MGISQEELANRAKLNRTYIGDIERGARNIALLNIKRLSVALGTTPSKLLAEMEDTISGNSKR
jgi:transcriptional regulator with XRE-family HTH domain